MIEDLARWVGPGDGGLEGPMSQPAGWIRVALRSRRESFDLFRGFHAEEPARRLLEELPYGRLIAQAARDNGVDGLLLAAMVEAESRFDPWAISPRGACGLLQLVPETAHLYGAPDPFDPRLNLRAGARYLRYLLGLYEGDVVLALAGYNAGPGNVARFGGVPPFRETTEYLERVLGRYVEHHRRVWLETEAGTLLSELAAPAPLASPTPGPARVAL